MEIGRVCIKIAGRDAGKRCVIVDVIDNTFVLVDGETRRKKCNIKHLEPTKELVKLEKGASHEEAIKALGIKEAKKATKTEKKPQAAAKKKTVKKKAE
jgi:large subunit ribosomal protein L14e